MWKIVISIMVMILVGGGTLVGAANAAAPGDLFYALDRGAEALRQKLTSNPDSVLELQKSLSEERLAEVRQLAASGDVYHLAEALDNLDQSLAEESQAAAVSGDAQAESGEQDETTSGDASADTTAKVPNPDKGGAYCTTGQKDEHHPVGDKLADRYTVTYEEIMGWFCQGYGFGEIDLAYSISQQAGVPIADVFAKRQEGKGWGQIMKEYDLKGKPDDPTKGKPDDPGKGNPDKGKPDKGKPDNPGKGNKKP